jgi:hypothetical protein
MLDSVWNVDANFASGAFLIWIDLHNIRMKERVAQACPLSDLPTHFSVSSAPKRSTETLSPTEIA